MNFLRERTAGLNLRERTARLSQNANEWKEKFQATSGTTSAQVEDHNNCIFKGSEFDSKAFTREETGLNSNSGQRAKSASGSIAAFMEQEGSTQFNGKEISVLASVTALIEAAKAQQEQHQLDMADPEVVETMKQIHTLRTSLKILRQTYRISMKERNKGLGSIR